MEQNKNPMIKAPASRHHHGAFKLAPKPYSECKQTPMDEAPVLYGYYKRSVQNSQGGFCTHEIIKRAF